jgi:hypothetical protein
MIDLKYNLNEEKVKYLDLNEHISNKGIYLSDLYNLLLFKPKEFLKIDIGIIFDKNEILIKVFYLLCNMLKEIDYENKIISINILAKIIAR